MTIGTPVSVGSNLTFSSQSLVTTAQIPAGSLITVFVGASISNQSMSGVTISDGINTYTLAIQNVQTSGVFSAGLWYCSNCITVPLGTTFTASPAATGPVPFVSGIAYVSGANGGLDKTNSSVSASALGFSLATGSLNNSSEVIFGALSTGATFLTYTEGAGFTSLYGTNAQILAGGSNFVYDVVSSTSSVAWAPSWTAATSPSYSGVIASFMATDVLMAQALL
jgi:hypothetical protein